MPRYLVPLALFLLLVVLLGAGLGLNPRAVPSPLIDRAAPDFRLPRLHEPDRVFTPAEMAGKVWILNVWASWCVSCRQEHGLLMELARSGAVPIIGLDYKDGRDDARRWLAEHGDPYVLSAIDADGRIGIDYGVYGVPETYVVDRTGVIRFKHVGPVTREVLEKTLLPLVRKLDA